MDDWYLSVPTDTDGNGKADQIKETELPTYINKDFFYRAKDGGYVFQSPTTGFKTSLNTRYVRVELREMLRRGNKKHKTKGVNPNNWVFDTAPAETKVKAGGVGGVLEGTLAINRVSTEGKSNQVGRVSLHKFMLQSMSQFVFTTASCLITKKAQSTLCMNLEILMT